MVVENRVGASGAIARRGGVGACRRLYVAVRRPPFTTVAAATPLTANYDPVKQFARCADCRRPAGVDCQRPGAVWVDAGNDCLPGRTRQAGLWQRRCGGVNHLALSELFKNRTELTSCMYRTGHRPATTDLLGGSIMTLTGTIPAVLPHLKSGKARALAVTGDKRSPLPRTYRR